MNQQEIREYAKERLSKVAVGGTAYTAWSNIFYAMAPFRTEEQAKYMLKSTSENKANLAAYRAIYKRMLERMD